MKAKTKKIIMYGIGGVVALMMLRNKGIVGSTASAVNSDGVPTGSGWGALNASLDSWLGEGEKRSDITNMLIPGVTKSDLEAYAAGIKYGEAANYTEQDYLNIDMVVN